MRRLTSKQIISREEKKGLRYRGSVSRKPTPAEMAQVDVWGDEASRKLKLLHEIQYGETVYVFEGKDAVYSEVPSRTGYARHKDVA